MDLSIDKALDKIIVVGDKVLIKPRSVNDKTNSGLYLPPGVQEKEKVQSGYIIKVGPGFPVPLPSGDSYEEPWKEKEDKVKNIPLQVKEGDLAIYLQSGAFEISYNKEKYFIVPQHSILMVVRDEDLFQ
ncbi:MAG: co-chaperone GroES [Cytophagaceae bacterium]